MTQTSHSNIPEDEWFALWRFDDHEDTRWEAEGPFKSRIKAEMAAYSYDPHLYETRVVHSVFTS